MHNHSIITQRPANMRVRHFERVPDVTNISRLAKVRISDVLIGLVAAGGIVYIGAELSIYSAIALYVFFFVGLIHAKPGLALVFIMATMPVIHDLGIGPVKLAIGDVNVILTLLALFLFGRVALFSSPFWIAAAAYLAACTISTVSNGIDTQDVTALLQMLVFLFIVTFVFSHFSKDAGALRSGLFAMVIVDLILGVIVMFSRSDFFSEYNKNAIGDQMCFAVLCATGLWWSSTGRQRSVALILSILSAVVLLLSLSRGAWVGAIVGSLTALTLLGSWRYAVNFAVLALPVLVVAWFFLPTADREYATDFSSQRYNIQARYQNFDNAMTEFNRSPLLGVGVGYRKKTDATNLFAFSLAETGVVGLGAFLLLLGTFGRMVWTVKQRISPTDPLFALYVIGAALMVAKLSHAMVDHFWQRGMLPVWMGVGIVIHAYAQVHAPRNQNSVAKARTRSRRPLVRAKAAI